MMIILGWLKIA